jgi:hypothetical protein
MVTKMQRLLSKRAQLCDQLASCAEMVQGTLVTKYLKCGKPRCRCEKGSPHGPKYYVSDKTGGLTRMLYVPVDTITDVQKRIALHHRFKKIGAEISKINRALLILNKNRLTHLQEV